MISVKTLQEVQKAQNHLIECRRTLENIKDVELAETEWTPGHGEKPHRARELERMIGDLNAMQADLDKLWS